MSEATWDPRLVSRISQLSVLARQLVEDRTIGHHRANHVARNIEFAAYKEYTPGDSLRSVDWRVVARTDKLVVRKQEAEADVPIWIVVDSSADLGTDGNPTPDLKSTVFGKLLVMASAIAYLCNKRGEKVGLHIMGDPLNNTPPSKRSLASILRTLAELKPQGSANIGSSFAQFSARLSRRSIVIVLSDWMEEPSTWSDSLANMTAMGHDLRCAHMYNPVEWNLEYSDAAMLCSPETGSELATDPESVRDEFKAVVANYKSEVLAAAHQAQAIWTFLPVREVVSLDPISGGLLLGEDDLKHLGFGLRTLVEARAAIPFTEAV